MAITVAELVNVVKGQDSEWQQVVSRTQNSLESLQRQSQQVTNQVASTFQQAGALIGPSLSQPILQAGVLFDSFGKQITSVGSTAQGSLSQVAASTQQVAAAIQNGLNQAAAAAPPVAVELNNINTVAQTLGQTVAANTQQAVAGMQSLGAGVAAASTSVTDLALRKAELLGHIKNVEGQIRSETKALADGIAKAQEYKAGQQAIGAATEEAKNKVAGLVSQHTLLKGELDKVNAALRATQSAHQGAAQAAASNTTATTQSASAQQAAGNTVNQTTGFFSRLKDFMGQTTNQITSQGTVWQGYDRIVTSVAGALAGPGGLTVGMSLALTIVGALASKFLHLGEEKKKQIQIDKEAIATFALFTRAQQAAIDSMSGLATVQRASLDLQRGTLLTNANLISSFQQIVTSQREIEKQTTNVATAFKNLSTEGGQVDLVITRGGLASRQMSKDAAELRSEIAASAQAINEQHKAMGPAIEAIMQMQAVTGATTEETLAWAQQTNAVAAKDLPMLREALNSNVNALNSFVASLERSTNRMADAQLAAISLRVALQQIKAPTFDVSATEQGLKNLEKTAIAGAEAARTQLGFTADRFEANRKNLEPYNKALERHAAVNAQGTTQTQRNADAQRIYKEKLSQANAEVQSGIKVLDLADKTQKVFADSTRKAGGSASAARPMLNEFAVGVLGIEKAISVVMSRMGDADLFGNITKKNRASVAEFKAASKELADAAEEMFRSMGVKVKVNAEQIASLGKDLAKPFLQQVLAFETLQSAIDKLNFQRAAGQLALLDNELKINGKTIELSITTFRQLEQTTVSSLIKMGFMFRTVFPQAKEALFDFKDALKQAEIGNQDFANKAAAYTSEWSKKTDKELEVVQERLKKFGTDAPSYSAGLIESLARVKKAIDDSIPVSIIKARLDFQQSIDSMIGNLEQMADHLRLSGDQWEAYVERGIRQSLEAANATLKEHERLSSEAIDKIVEKWRKGLLTLPGIWDEIFKDASASTRRSVDDMLTILNNLPGGVAEVGRKIESEINRWWTIFDRTIRLIERALGEKETEGLSGVISKVGDLLGGIFKKAGDETKSQSEVWADQVAGALGGLTAQASAAGGLAGGAFGSAMVAAIVTTVTTGLKKGPWWGGLTGLLTGGGVLTGVVSGFIGKLFGKSDEQKEEERRAEEDRQLQIEQIRQQLSKGYQELQQAVLETASRAHALLEAIIGRARVPKAEIQGFVKDMTRLLRMLVKELATIPKEVTDEIKITAENLAPAAELMAAMPLVFDGVNKHMPMAESQARLYVNDWRLLTNLIGELAEETPNKLEKEIRKFSNRLMPAAELLVTVSEGMNAVFSARPVSASQFQNWAGSIKIILVEVGKLEEEFDRYGVRKAAVFAEQAAKTTGFLKEGSEAIKSLTDIPTITASDLQPFSGGVEAIITTVSNLSRSVNSQLVAEAQRFSQGAGATVTFMLNTATSFKELEDMKDVMPSTIMSVGEGIKLSITILAQVAREVDQNMRDDAEQLSASIGSVFSVITDAAQAFEKASTTKDLYPATMRILGDGIKLAITELSRVSRSVDVEMIAEANNFSVSVGQVVNLIGEAGAAMRSLEGEKFTVDGLIMLIGNIEEATRRTITLAKSIDKDDIAQAVEFAISSQKIFDATAAGISIQKDMAGLEPISISQWDNWVLNVTQQTSALARAVDSTHQGMLLSAEFRANTDVIKENVIGALSNILATANAAAGYLAGSANFNSLIAPAGFSASAFSSVASGSTQSFASAPLAPASPTHPSGNTYYVTIHNHGSVLDDVRFRESVRQFIRDEDRTSTVFIR